VASAFKVSVKVEGLSESAEAMRELSKATSRNVLRRAMKNAAEHVLSVARSKAPKNTGKLILSIGTSASIKRGRKPSNAFAFLAAGSTSPVAHLQEFGTAHHAPQPFLRPAIDAKAEATIKAFKDELKAEVAKAVARQAKKNARLLAKGR
jgi:HK97 gp10 family phage protein